MHHKQTYMCNRYACEPFTCVNDRNQATQRIIGRGGRQPIHSLFALVLLISMASEPGLSK